MSPSPAAQPRPPSRPSSRPPTLDEVAARAGVGRGTVSRVINGSSQVTESTRAAVLRAVEDLGYVPNQAARSLVTRAMDTIALVVSESEERVFGEPFFGGLVRGISEALVTSPRQLVVTMARSGPSRLRLDSYLSRQHVDGVLLLSLHGDDPLPDQLIARGLPAVLGGRPSRPSPLHFVDMDNAGGAAAAVAHLAASGRTRIATVTGPQDMGAGIDRLEGYRQGLAGAGLPADESLVVPGDFSEQSGLDAGRRLIACAQGLDAIFAASDPMAVGVLAALAEAGLRVPQDVAVIGFDDSPISRHTRPSLTTVHQPVRQMGEDLVKLLDDVIAGRPADDVILGTHLVLRDSA